MRFLFDAYNHQLKRRTTDQNWRAQVELLAHVFDRDGSGDFSMQEWVYIYRTLQAEREHFPGTAPQEKLDYMLTNAERPAPENVLELSPDGQDRMEYSAAQKLQAVQRGRKARKEVEAKREEKQQREEAAAARSDLDAAAEAAEAARQKAAAKAKEQMEAGWQEYKDKAGMTYWHRFSLEGGSETTYSRPSGVPFAYREPAKEEPGSLAGISKKSGDGGGGSKPATSSTRVSHTECSVCGCFSFRLGRKYTFGLG